ncbi:hypothetical protein ACFL1X_00300 [Candidatus Hydrogenedentota bacterium]
MNARLLELMRELAQTRLETIEKLMEIGITRNDAERKADGKFKTVGDSLHRLSRHDETHALEIARARGTADSYLKMNRNEDFVSWFLRDSMISRGRLLGELIGLDDEGLKVKPAPEKATIEEIIEHLIRVEGKFLREGILRAMQTEKGE